jgi:hypothetical protein
LTLTSTEGCVISSSVLINLLELPPAVNIGDILDICNGATLDAGFDGQGMSYLWNTGETTQGIMVSVTDT